MAELQLLIENKKEYMEHLYEVLVPQMMFEFENIYSKHIKSKDTLRSFQQELCTIPEFSNDEQLNMFSRFTQRSKCAYFHNLVRGIIVTSIKIHCLKDNLDDIKIRVPSATKFYHMCLINSARSVWKKPYLFYHDIRTIERQYNINLIEILLTKL